MHTKNTTLRKGTQYTKFWDITVWLDTRGTPLTQPMQETTNLIIYFHENIRC